MIPERAVCDGRTRVLMAVVRRHAAAGRVTYDDLVASTALCRSTVHFHVVNLERQGLVTWERGRAATLRPLVAEVMA